MSAIGSHSMLETALRLLLVFAFAAASRASAADLRTLAAGSTLELTTTGRKSGQPRTVTVWFVAEGERLFVQAGRRGKTDWYRNLGKDPRVTVALGTRRFAGRGVRIDDETEAARVRELFRKKYWLAWIASWVGAGFGNGKVVRIDLEPTASPQTAAEPSR